jgi:plasmid stabilization system protein ParE
MPDAGRPSELLEPGLRVFPVEGYLIYYTKARGGIRISRVIHGMRDQARVLAGER